jgi:hypothetical protein
MWKHPLPCSLVVARCSALWLEKEGEHASRVSCSKSEGLSGACWARRVIAAAAGKPLRRRLSRRCHSQSPSLGHTAPERLCNWPCATMLLGEVPLVTTNPTAKPNLRHVLGPSLSSVCPPKRTFELFSLAGRNDDIPQEKQAMAGKPHPSSQCLALRPARQSTNCLKNNSPTWDTCATNIAIKLCSPQSGHKHNLHLTAWPHYQVMFDPLHTRQESRPGVFGHSNSASLISSVCV